MYLHKEGRKIVLIIFLAIVLVAVLMHFTIEVWNVFDYIVIGVLVIAAPDEAERAFRAQEAGSQPSLEEAIEQGLAEGEPKSALAKRLAKAYGLPRAELYKRITGQD